MICEEHGFLFIHIKRTGGNSVYSFFSPLGSFLPTDNINTKFHCGASAYYEHLGHERWSKFFKWAIVRNPWARMLSLYHNRHRDKASDDIDSHRRRFTRWLLRYVKPPDFEQTDKLMIDKKIVMDYICRFETLQQDFQKVCRQCGIEYQPLPRKNSTKRTHYTSYYTDKSRKIVKERCQLDITTFDFQFGK